MKTQTPNRQLVRLLLAQICALAVVTPVLAQQVKQETAPATPPADKPVAPVTETAATGEEETIVLSPFTVQSSKKDIGYYAENTLAGSRLNTKVSDLAAAITIVTKQQLSDTSSTDINDVFMYEAGTEGANTYTQTDVSRNGVPRDTLAGYSSDAGVPATRATANRVRGLGSPDAAQNNYPAIARVPFDSYNTNSLEISRGPNSLLFGTGSPAGIVNQSTAQASTSKRLTTVEARFGSWDDQRLGFSHNQPLIKDKLAFYVAGLWEEKGFRRKPSADESQRYYGAITYQPFRKTKITASFEHYHNYNNRPNSQTPRDYVTPWLQAGRPAYDPIARSILILDTGVTKGPYTTSTASPPNYPAGILIGNGALTTAPTSTTPNPLYIPGIQFGPTGSNRLTVFTDNGNMLYAVRPIGEAFGPTAFPTTSPLAVYNSPAVASRTPAQWMIIDRRLTSSAGPAAPAGYGGFVQPSITDKSLYDWEHVNLLQMNYGEMTMRTYNAEFQQEILPSLNFSAGWFRQELDAVENYTVSNANAITTLYVDTNYYNMDGTFNPYFGSPYLADISPDTFKTPEINDNYRALLAYELDLTKKSGFWHYLGKHRMMGLWSKQMGEQRTFRYRNTFDGGDIRYQANPSAANAIVANSGITRIFYVGQNGKGLTQRAPGHLGQPGYGGPENVNVNTYNWSTNQWESSPLHMSQQLFYAGKYGLDEKVIVGNSAALTSYFWDERVVGTFGWRKDKYKARNTNVNGTTTTNTGLATDLYVNGFAINPIWTEQRLTNWYELEGTTSTIGIVVKPLRWQSGEVLVHYNQSDNFNPPSGIPIDFFGTPLPKSTGEGKDYGVSVSLFNNKLVAKLNWFDSTNENAPATAATTAIGRVSRMDTTSFRSWADYVVRIRNGQDPTAANFANNTLFPLTQNMKNEIAALMKVPAYDNWPPANINGTQTNKAKGEEFQLIYNPKRNWNIKATASHIESTYQNVAPEIDAWIATRLPIWQNAVALDMPASVTTSGGTPLSLQRFWTGYGPSADARQSNATGANPSWVTHEGFYNSAVAPEINVAKALQNKPVPNERPWTFNVITNYAFESGMFKNFTVGGGYRWADEATAGFYGDPNNRDSLGLIVAPDLNRPITVESESHVDLWVSYRCKILANKVNMKIQLNVRDALQSGELQPVAYNLDGSAFAYRIVDPRQFFLTTTFEF